MKTKQILKRALPAVVFNLVRDLPWIVRGWTTQVPAGQGPMPPLHMMFDGPRDYALFRTMGEETLHFYKSAAGLKSDAVILDIGCGIGRKTIPLLDYLDPNALYVGMDLDRRGIDWLMRNVTSINQRFVFMQFDIYNKFYNPKGALDPGKLTLPFPDDSFDLVALWSVFTHMYPADIRHYLQEISRVLKPGGTLSASYFLYNDETIARMQRSETETNFFHELPDCRTTNPNIPEDAIAIRDAWLKDVFISVGLQAEPVLYGSWSGHIPYPGATLTNFQDIVLARKSQAALL